MKVQGGRSARATNGRRQPTIRLFSLYHDVRVCQMVFVVNRRNCVACHLLRPAAENLRPALRRAGQAHQLRHPCATLLLNAGAPVLTVQSILGHRFIDTALNSARLYDSTVAAD